MEKSARFEKALKKILRAIVNLSGKVSSQSKDISQLKKDVAYLKDTVNKLGIITVINTEKIKTIKSDDIKRIRSFLNLVATKKGVKNAITLLQKVDIDGLKDSQLTWSKLLAGIIAGYGVIEVIKKIANG